MSEKKVDSKGESRNLTVAFKLSQDEKTLLKEYVALSGLTEREYLLSRALQTDVVVHGNPRVYRALKNYMELIYTELQRIHKSEEISDDFTALMEFTFTIYDRMKEEQ